MRAAAVVLAMSYLFHCPVVSPPPLLMRHAPVAPARPGSVELTGIGGGFAGIFHAGAGGEGRVGVQVAPRLALGVGFGGGSGYEKPRELDANILLAGRLYGRVDLGVRELLALDFGLGAGGLDSGLRYATADLALSAGYTLRRRVAFYGGPVFACSLPLVAGELIADDVTDPYWATWWRGRTWLEKGVVDRPRTPGATFFLGGAAGIAVRILGGLWASFEGLYMWSWALHGEQDGIGGYTGGLRYVFGP